MSSPENGSSDQQQGEAQEPRSPEEIQAEIEQTRRELGDSVEALTAKLDVKTRAREKVDASRQQAADQLQSARRSVSGTAARGKDAVTDERGRLRPAVPATAGVIAVGVVVAVLVWRWRR